MFPESFTARVGQRMAIWGAMMGFLLILYAATDTIYDRQMSWIAADRQHATATALGFVGQGAVSSDPGRAEEAKKLVGAIESINERQQDITDNHRQNKLLIALLALFVVGEILFL